MVGAKLLSEVTVKFQEYERDTGREFYSIFYLELPDGTLIKLSDDDAEQVMIATKCEPLVYELSKATDVVGDTSEIIVTRAKRFVKSIYYFPTEEEAKKQLDFRLDRKIKELQEKIAYNERRRATLNLEK